MDLINVLHVQDIIRYSLVLFQVYVIAIPQSGLVAFVHKSRKLGLVLMSTMMVIILISMFSFLLLNAVMGWREMKLCASLIKQMEATQQAERKSMNKSVAFSSASHDIRASLAGLIGLVEMSCEEVVADSELETNLKQMGACINDLQGKIVSSNYRNLIPFFILLWCEQLKFFVHTFREGTDLFYAYRATEFYS